MGLTWDDINSGANDVASILNKGMAAWNSVTGKAMGTTSPSIQPASPAAASGTTLSQSPAKGAANTSPLATVPTWAWLAGGGVLVWFLSRRKR
jgi:lysozyme family protein